jgi:hypothetical protein
MRKFILTPAFTVKRTTAAAAGAIAAVNLMATKGNQKVAVHTSAPKGRSAVMVSWGLAGR